MSNSKKFNLIKLKVNNLTFEEYYNLYSEEYGKKTLEVDVFDNGFERKTVVISGFFFPLFGNNKNNDMLFRHRDSVSSMRFDPSKKIIDALDEFDLKFRYIHYDWIGIIKENEIDKFLIVTTEYVPF